MSRRFSATLAAAGRGDGGRWVEVPFDAREAFGQARPPVRGTGNGAAFRSRLSVYREYAEWVAEAKRDETRKRRIAGVLEQLRARAGGT